MFDSKFIIMLKINKALVEIEHDDFPEIEEENIRQCSNTPQGSQAKTMSLYPKFLADMPLKYKKVFRLKVGSILRRVHPTWSEVS